jgi:hypothetical protein
MPPHAGTGSRARGRPARGPQRPRGAHSLKIAMSFFSPDKKDIARL